MRRRLSSEPLQFKLIPKLRNELEYWGKELINPGLIPYTNDFIGRKLLHIVDELWRREAVHKARVTAEPITPERNLRLLRMAATNPDVPYRELAKREGVDGGRVSEALAGKRGRRK